MRTALLFIHIASASVWFGHKLAIPRDIRMSVGTPELARSLVERMRGVARLGIGSAVLTILSGIGLLWVAGWSASPILGLGIMSGLAAVAVGAAKARSEWSGFERAVGGDELATAAAFGRRFSRSLHIENALWILALAAMIAG